MKITQLGIGLLSLYALVAWAGDDLDQSEARALVAAGKIMPLNDLLNLYPRRLRGQLLDLELEREDGRVVYELEVLDHDGIVREIQLDAETGALISEEIEED
ncbi:hypothetical protein BFW38_13245 [Terasakiispira papahanaumokuakeensis]|uniref:PepSY domain-containing protein n=1 Tax=Terasakiispira papahanaumokuakeensis TaxID=197479 RepID=A0A1E2VCH9_9GAMM|nr:PepSY domain-containing protein [Terasakiispira papahanaumokuakeensis]ODC04355.1 hypothetical protein BFW38_13245 [Terasakiispira papahanaumokuakeensis]